MLKQMTALLLAAAFACGAALPAMAEQATPETAAQPDPTEWADEAQDVTEAEEAPVYQQADAQEVATGETAASLTVTAADCTAQFIDEAYRLFLPVNTDMAALTIETGAELAAATGWTRTIAEPARKTARCSWMKTDSATLMKMAAWHLANVWSTAAGTITMKRPVPSAAGLWCCRMAARCFTA